MDDTLKSFKTMTLTQEDYEAGYYYYTIEMQGGESVRCIMDMNTGLIYTDWGNGDF